MFANCLNSGPSGLEAVPSTAGLLEPFAADSSQPDQPLPQSSGQVDLSANAMTTTGFTFSSGNERRFLSARDRKKCFRNPSTIEDLVYSINNEFDGVFDDDDEDDDSIVDG